MMVSIIAVQQNLNLFEVCGGNGVVNLVPHGRSSSPMKNLLLRQSVHG